MVDFGISRICAKLLEEAKSLGKPVDGTVKLSTDFLEKSAVVGSVKIEAPDAFNQAETFQLPNR